MANTAFAAWGLTTQLGDHWSAKAACGWLVKVRGVDADAWFPVGEKMSADNRDAARICWTRCPVRGECYESAVGRADGEIRGGHWWVRGAPVAACVGCRMPLDKDSKGKSGRGLYCAECRSALARRLSNG